MARRPHPEDNMPTAEARAFLEAQLAAAEAAVRAARDALSPLEIARNEALLDLLAWQSRHGDLEES